MRKKVLGAVAAVVLVFAMAPAIVTAQTDSAPTDATTTDQETDTTTDRVAERQARIDEYKQRVTDRLTAAQERRIAGACSAAQGKVTTLQSNLSSAIERRRTAYANISDKLDEVVRKLQAASVDTTELETAITEMDRQAAAVITAAEAYQSTLADLAAMDCEADPQGFQAALTVAREERSALVTQAQALRDYINGTIKTILQGIRAQLAGDGAEES